MIYRWWLGLVTSYSHHGYSSTSTLLSSVNSRPPSPPKSTMLLPSIANYKFTLNAVNKLSHTFTQRINDPRQCHYCIYTVLHRHSASCRPYSHTSSRSGSTERVDDLSASLASEPDSSFPSSFADRSLPTSFCISPEAQHILQLNILDFANTTKASGLADSTSTR